MQKEKGSLSEHRPHRESKSPEEVGTNVSDTIVEAKANYGISVKQENCLFSRIPYNGNQEIVTANKGCKEKTNNDKNQRRPKRKQIEDDLNINVEATFQGDLTIGGINCQLPNVKKFEHNNLSDTVMGPSAVSCQKMPWNKVNGKFEDTKSSSKLQSDLGAIYGCYDSVAKDSFNGSSASLVNDFGSHSSVEDKGSKEACDEKIIHEDPGTMERTFFPMDTHNTNDSRLVMNSMSLKGHHECGDQFQVGIPSLELALGSEMKQSQKGMLPFFPDSLEAEKGDDSVAASLSLSLSFPSSNKEPTKPASEDEHHVNSSMLLFGRFKDK